MIVPRSLRLAGVAVGVSLLVLAGCSGEESEDAEVRSVVTGFFSDLADGDETACDALTGQRHDWRASPH